MTGLNRLIRFTGVLPILYLQLPCSFYFIFNNRYFDALCDIYYSDVNLNLCPKIATVSYKAVQLSSSSHYMLIFDYYKGIVLFKSDTSGHLPKLGPLARHGYFIYMFLHRLHKKGAYTASSALDNDTLLNLY
jgi:hypothetical protein